MCSWRIFSENIYLSVSHDFFKFDRSSKSWCDIPRGTTQGWVYPRVQPQVRSTLAIMTTSMNHLHLPSQNSSIQWVVWRKKLIDKIKMAFISKQDYDPLHMDGILDSDGWCPSKQIVTK
jgi:hypothetical protein